MKKVYLGVVGQIACGKGVLVDCLVKKHGFISFSLSTIVHQELQKRGIKNFNRKTLQDIGDDLRKKYDGAVLVKRAIRQINMKWVDKRGLGKAKIPVFCDLGRADPAMAGEQAHWSKKTRCRAFQHNPLRIIIEGIRNTAEVEYLKKKPNFVLIGVKAKRELRFQRLLKRNKPWDPKTYADFLKVDRRDLGIGQKSLGQQVGKCLAYCDYVLTNNKDVRDFERKVRRLINLRIF